MKLSGFVFVFAFLAATLWGQGQFGANDLFVAVDGNAAWSGRLAAPDAGRTDGPLPNPQAVLMRIRQLKTSAAITFPVTVWIRGGSYQVRAPLNFSPEDSGPVTFVAYPGEQPVLDGGERIKNWTEQKVNGAAVWVADVSATLGARDGFRSLFVDGQRRQGSDNHSIVADPLVKNWKARDFTLSKDSPAWALGFEPIDMSTVGPRPPEKRH